MDGLTSAGSQADLVSPLPYSQDDTVQQFLAQPRCEGFAEPSRHSCTPAILHQEPRERWVPSGCAPAARVFLTSPWEKMSLTPQLTYVHLMLCKWIERKSTAMSRFLIRKRNKKNYGIKAKPQHEWPKSLPCAAVHSRLLENFFFLKLIHH